MELILASASPRRKELLEKIGLPFTVQPAKGEERITQKSPAAVVMELSRQKAEEIAAAQTEDCIIIGADTVVARGDKIMGKPKDAADAKQMLRSIADDCHQVYTGVCLVKKGPEGEADTVVSFYDETDVNVSPMTEKEIREYADSEEPMDKAGSYAVQGFFARYIDGLKGSYANVMGLPVHLVYQELKKLGAL